MALVESRATVVLFVSVIVSLVTHVNSHIAGNGRFWAVTIVYRRFRLFLATDVLVSSKTNQLIPTTKI